MWDLIILFPRALIISKDEEEYLFEYDLRPAERKEMLLAPDGKKVIKYLLRFGRKASQDSPCSRLPSRQQYVHTLVKLLSKISKIETLNYILTHLSDALEMDSSFVSLIRSFHDSGVDAWQPFYNLISQRVRENEPYLIHQASQILSAVAILGPPMTDGALAVYLDWLRSELNGEVGGWVLAFGFSVWTLMWFLWPVARMVPLCLL